MSEAEDRLFARALAIDTRANGAFERLKAKATRVLKGQATVKKKYIYLARVADEASGYIAPSTPCRRGCSHCCYMAVPISLPEARLLSEASGRPVREAAGYPPGVHDLEGSTKVLEKNVERFTGSPCPFLVENECSVYEARPIPCRMHHVLEDDALKCDTTKSRVPVASYDSHWIDAAAAALTIYEPYADIREFFPKETP